jgi:hypothetical protein
VLSSPLTPLQGAFYVYTSHLGPWIARNEPQLAALKTKLADWVNSKRQIAWNHLVSFITQQTGLNLNSNSDAPPVDGPQSPAMNLFRIWGPTILTPFRPTQTPSDAAPTSGEEDEEETSGSGNESPSDTATIRARRLKVEAELAALMQMEREASSRLGKAKDT